MVKVTSMITYLVFYINEFSKVIKSTNDVSFNILAEYGVLDYLEKHYGVLHTQGRLFVVMDIMEILQERGYFPVDLRITDLLERVYD